MSLLDQFEVQFNELSYGEIVDGELSELQPVELAGIINQEISRIQNELSPSENVESIRLFLSPHDFRRLSKFETLLRDGLEEFEVYETIQKIRNYYNGHHNIDGRPPSKKDFNEYLDSLEKNL